MEKAKALIKGCFFLRLTRSCIVRVTSTMWLPDVGSRVAASQNVSEGIGPPERNSDPFEMRFPRELGNPISFCLKRPLCFSWVTAMIPGQLFLVQDCSR